MKHLVVFTLMLLPSCASWQGTTEVWTSGQGGYESYRIPSLIRANDGTMLAFCEGRVDGSADSGDIDLVMRRSTDEGRTWGPMEVVWNDGVNTCGNPCPVVDRETGKIFLLATRNLGHDTESEIIRGVSEGTRTVWVMESVDHGRSWSAAKEITPETKSPSWSWYATGPGAGIQLQQGAFAGRLVIPCDHIEKESKKYFSHAIFSDDHGMTWQIGGTTPLDKVNECEVVELEDGRLLLNMRNYDRSKKTRQRAESLDGGVTWIRQKHDVDLPEPICQASIRRLRWASGDQPGMLMFSNPASSSQREKLSLRFSSDDGESWMRPQLIYAGSSAYSCLAVTQSGAPACLFEVDSYGRILYSKFRMPVNF